MSQTGAVEPVGSAPAKPEAESGVLHSTEDIAAALERRERTKTHAQPRDAGGSDAAKAGGSDAAKAGGSDAAKAGGSDAAEDDAPLVEDGGGNSDAPDEDGGGHGQEEGDAEPDARTQADEESRQETVEAPATWKKDEKALFAKLPADLQKAVARRESEREAFVNAKGQEAATARQEKDLAHRWIHENLGKVLQAAQVAVEGDFAGFDWLELQRKHPTEYLRLDAERKKRMAGVEQALDVYRQFQARERLQGQAAEGQRLKAEMDAALPRLNAVMGRDFDRPAFRRDLTGYLRGVGAPDEHINDIRHGYILEVCAKAMLYDKQEKARQSAAKKVAAAPRVQGAAARRQETGRAENIRSLRAALAKDPDNNDILQQLILAGA